MSGHETEVVASHAELAARLRRCVAELGRRHPTHTVRVIISTCPPGHPDTEERPARPVIIDLEPPAARVMTVV